MPRKRQGDKPRRTYGSGGVQCIIKDQKYRVWAPGGTDHNGKRQRPTRIVYGKAAAADKVLRDLQRDLDDGAYIAPDRMTVGDWLQEWLRAEYGVTIGMSRDELLRQSKVPGRTVETYASIIRAHMLPALGDIPIQRLRTTHLRNYFDGLAATLSPVTVEQHYILLQRILDGAVRERIIGVNVAREMVGKPKSRRQRGEDSHEEAMLHCWDVDEVQTFLHTCETAELWELALYTLALDAGERRGELLGHTWADVDWERGDIGVERSLTRGGRDPIFGPTKGKRRRRHKLMPETLALLRRLRKHQLELRMRLGPLQWHDHNMIFAQEPSRRTNSDTWGCPILPNHIGQRSFARLVKRAGVKPIKFHGLRHTCATMRLSDGQPPHEVSALLGHKTVATTLEIYAHVLPSSVDRASQSLRRKYGYTD